MSLTPYPHQDHQIGQTRAALRQHRRVLLQAPTGSGKTVMATTMVSRASSKLRTWFVVHRQELLDQSAATFDLADIQYGFVAAGYRPNPFQPTQICSIDTLKRRHENLEPPGIIFVDEAHHVGAKGWAAVMDAYPEAYIIGLSATPERLDGKGLDSQFDAMVRGPSIQWLIANKFLADYRIFPPKGGGADRSQLKHFRAGEFKHDEAEALMDRPTITGDIIDNYRKHAIDKRGIAFCVSVKHSIHTAEALRAAGIVAVHLDGKTEKHERRRLIQDYRDCKIQVLTNVNICGEGFDVPGVEAVVDANPTKSIVQWMQRNGRAMRWKTNGSDALIFDHARNWEEHGLPDDDRNWSLEGKEGRCGGAADDEAAVQVRQCPKCFSVHRPAPKCPECGHVYKLKPREVDQVDGELEEVDKETLRRRARQQQGMAESLDDLIALGRERGYKNPAAWAAKVWTGRKAGRGGRGRSKIEQQAELFGG